MRCGIDRPEMTGLPVEDTRFRRPLVFGAGWFGGYLLAFVLLVCSNPLSLAEGRAQVSFKEVFLPQLRHDQAIMEMLASFDIDDTGTCQAVIGNRVSYTFPCVFPAKRKGDKGPYRYLLVIDRIEAMSSFVNRIIAGGGRVNLHALGISIWPLKETAPPPSGSK